MTDNASDKPQAAKGQGQAMWGGRFSAKPAELMQAINVSIGFDKRLWAQDLAGSRAHARMLISQGVIASADGEEILKGLDAIEGEKSSFVGLTYKSFSDVDKKLAELADLQLMVERAQANARRFALLFGVAAAIAVSSIVAQFV